MLSDFPSPASWLIKKSALELIGGFHQHKSMPTVDLSTILELSKMGKFSYIDETLTYYRRQMQQATRTRAVEISLGSKIIFSEFYSKLSKTERENTGITQAQLIRILDNRIAISHSLAARNFLSNKKYPEAIQNYATTLFYSKDLLLNWRFKAFVGLCFSILRIDLEKALKWIGKPSY